MNVYVDDKRLLPSAGPVYWAERTSEKDWHYCKYCYRETPTFTLAEGWIGSLEPVQILRCCWECGSGLDLLFEAAPAADIHEGGDTPPKGD